MKKILIIEDMELNRDLLVQILEEDYKTVEAPDGPTGLEVARHEIPDLILLDLGLPGMDSWEVAEHLRADDRVKEIPIIAVISHVTAEDREGALAAGCDDHIAKPIDQDGLIEKIHQLIGV
jgi:CheY-like chemotaxis protein